jgi:hypothetical protein
MFSGVRTRAGWRQHRFEEIRVGHRVVKRATARTTGQRRPQPVGENCRRSVQPRRVEKGTTMGLVLWIIAAILVIWGIVSLVRGQVLMGAVLIVVGLLVGPGGVSIFT